MGVGVFVHAHGGGDVVLGFEGAVGHHRVDVNYVVGQTVSVVVAIFSVVLHLELTSCHLRDAVVDRLAGVDRCFQVGVFKREQGSARFRGFVTAADVDEDANVDVGGDGDGLGEYGHSVAEFGGIVCERLGGESFAFGADGSVDGGSDDGFVAG